MCLSHVLIVFECFCFLSLKDFLRLGSKIILKMESEQVARLIAHCKPGDHLDFKVSMYNQKDIKDVGGEFGVAPGARKDDFRLFSSDLGVKMKDDTEFEAGWGLLHQF